ncbi:hemogen isoform X2 [Heterodontus francisci]|uniref:hemogen isoform X2 n=1 Tax=Heterodontus francisci TaxID=7792 RepID=UPI00355C236D
MDTIECSQNTTGQEIPGVLPHRLRDREKLRKRKLEAQEKKTSQAESKGKRGGKAKAGGTSNKHTPKPEAKPEPSPKPVLTQEHKEDIKDKPAHPDPESERPAPLEESAKLSLIGETPTTSTDEPGESKPAGVEIPEILQLQAEDVPGENAAFEQQMVLHL